jgi:hypothetical protein
VQQEDAGADVADVDAAVVIRVTGIVGSGNRGAGGQHALQQRDVIKVDVGVLIDVAGLRPDLARECEPAQEQPHPMFRTSKHRPRFPIDERLRLSKAASTQGQVPRLAYSFFFGSLRCLMRPP